ncbi:MAG: hypothetical protein R3C58_00135 [Parvularculaceae bacterium]
MILRCVTYALMAVFAAAPLLWLIVFGVFTAAAAAEIGHLPSYGAPDPKHLKDLAPLHLASSLLLIAAIFSPFVIASAATARLAFRIRPVIPRGLALLFFPAFIAAAVMVFADPFGLVEWLLD